MNNNKKVGGIYSICNENTKWEMLQILESGRRCENSEEFFQYALGAQHYLNERFVVLAMPGAYILDLENDAGVASAVDAARSYLELILEGFSFFVWDRELRRYYYIEQNEYIYEPLEKYCMSFRKDAEGADGPAEGLRREDTSSGSDVAPADQEVRDLLKEARDTLIEYSSDLEELEQYESNAEDSKSILKKAANCRALAGRCERKIYELDIINRA